MIRVPPTKTCHRKKQPTCVAWDFRVAWKSARCTEALKKEYSAAKQMQRDCNKFLAKLSDNNKEAKEMTFAHEVETAKELAKQLDTRKKAVEQLEQIMQGMDEDEMEQAFNQCREALEM